MAREWFSMHEFECKCGCGINNPSEGSVRKLNMARTLAGVPFIINRGSSCETHNYAVGGSETSSHIASDEKVSYAFDIKCTNSSDRYAILHGLFTAGFTRVGISKTFIHCDDDPNKAPRVTWLY